MHSFTKIGTKSYSFAKYKPNFKFVNKFLNRKFYEDLILLQQIILNCLKKL